MAGKTVEGQRGVKVCFAMESISFAGFLRVPVIEDCW